MFPGRASKKPNVEPPARASENYQRLNDTGRESLPFSDLDPARFEILVYRLKKAELSSTGHKVRHTQAGGDRGLDIVVRSPSGKVTQIAQCKNYRDRFDAPALRRELLKIALHSHRDPSMLDRDPDMGPISYELWCPGDLTDRAAEWIDTWPQGWTVQALTKDAAEVMKSYAAFKGIDWNVVGEKVVSDFKNSIRPCYFNGVNISERVRGQRQIYEHFFEGKVVVDRDALFALARYVAGPALLLLLVMLDRGDRLSDAATAEKPLGLQGRMEAKGGSAERHHSSAMSKCQNAYVTFGTAKRGWSWAWTRQVLLASPEFRVVPRVSRAPGEISFKVYDYNATYDVLVAQCDGETCSDLAATYKGLVPSAVTLDSGCGPSPTFQGNGRVIKIMDGDDFESNLPDIHDYIESCARLSICLFKVRPSTQGDPASDCRTRRREFDLSCARRKTCSEVVDCLGGSF